MSLRAARKPWRCQVRTCRSEASIFKGSFFDGAHLPCSKVLELGYYRLNRIPATSMVAMSGCLSRTVTKYNEHFRELVADSLDFEDCQIGGPGVIVEIDESKFGRRKYNRGHRIEGIWVLSGIERTLEKRVFIQPVESRDEATLLAVINRFVRPGSIIYSDMWRGYIGLTPLLGLEHHTVNHSGEFVSREGVHTNTIEATWCGLKIMIPKRNRNKEIEGHLWEYVWQKKNVDRLWDGFFDALKEIEYQ